MENSTALKSIVLSSMEKLFNSNPNFRFILSLNESNKTAVDEIVRPFVPNLTLGRLHFYGRRCTSSTPCCFTAKETTSSKIQYIRIIAGKLAVKYSLTVQDLGY